MFDFFDDFPFITIVLTFIVVVAVTGGLSYVGAHIASRYEAEAFNRVTGANVTSDDAFWLDLKVVLPPKENALPQDR